MRVYKYMSMDAFKKSAVGGQLFLKASRLYEFNDPFEGTGIICGEPSIQFAKEWNEYFNLTENGSNNNDETVKGLCRGHMIGSWHQAKIFDSWMRVVCFSDVGVSNKVNELLMWSHYADFGRGVRLELELDEMQFHLKDVVYRIDRPKLELEQVKSFSSSIDETLFSFINSCLLSKPLCWQYEHEKRLVEKTDFHHFCYQTPADELKHESEQDLLLKITGESLKEVVVGPKIMNVGKVQDEIKQVRENGFNAVSFKRAIFDQESYGYKITNLFNG